VHLAHRWIDKTGEPLPGEPERTLLASPIDPGTSSRQSIRVRMPDVVGRYRLRPDMVQEGQFWSRVVDAAAFALADPLRGETVGLVVVAGAGGVEPGELRRFVAERVSRSKVPTRVVVLDTIPLGPTGKVQRSRLPELLGLT